MGRSKKKSMAQTVSGMATSWLPKPLADFFATPFGAIVFMVIAPFLLATGIVTVTWNNGIPSINFNREKAVVVGQRIEQQVEWETRRAAQQQQQPQSYQQQQQYQQQPMRQGFMPMQPPQAAQQFQPAYR